MSTTNKLTNVYTGKVAHRYGFNTAIDKVEVKGALYLTETGLEGDECAEMRHHGGPERALHQYPLEHYQYWSEKYGDHVKWTAPGMGENISSEGMTEETVCLGDRFQWGEAIIEVSQPRSPCYKLNQRWGVEGFSVDMQEISRCGWLYRVIKPGMVSVDEPLTLIERVPNAMSLKGVCDIFFGDPLNQKGLELLLQQEKLSDSWMSKVKQRLETNEVENWQFRLQGRDRAI
ncbi:MOSC domain-containing protein [Photobacterium rosenbergii]|uniref:MOSC domain-containing protein n=1 Tax=Photobacterium rosenbergii TaxID=294936 RepID=A0A2T3NJA3_9GAMM|nr:MOSC domain-containing protein [Photobacterium rosenbergii]PSW15578.1 MOSC domain-containing protein [Photobacterium rosenbergii]